MRKTLRYLLFTGVVICLYSCFDITEEVTINKDGSGFYVSTMDATEYLDAYERTGETAMRNAKYTLDSGFAETVKKYASVKGVKNVVADTSQPDIYKVSMKFATVEALNKALYLDKKDKSLENLYAWSKGQLTRKDHGLGIGDMNDESQKEMMKYMFGDVNYTIIMNVPGKIKGFSNKAAKVSKNRKSVTLAFVLNDVIDEKVSLGNVVRYK